ncbi:MAG: GHKL domain-containing protein [Eubacteriales bacterium]|nr:GHKL domain-containing protein [Eubacteriales bacterium]
MVAVLLNYFTALLMGALLKGKYETAFPIKRFYYFVLLLIPAFSIAIGYIIIVEWGTLGAKSFIICSILFFLNVLVFYLFDQISKTYQKQQEIESMEQNKRYFRHELEVMEQAQLKLDCLKHDMKNHFYRIEVLAKENNPEEIINYVEQGKEHLIVENQYVTTGNKSLDCLMNFKLEEAKKRGIIFTTDMVMPDKLNINSFDLNTILGNLLDNAMEAVEKTSEKRLDISIKYNRNVLTIKIGNSFDGEINKNLQTTKANPSEHGFGLKSVQQVVDKYHGLLNQKVDSGYFLTKIVLYND